MFRNTVGNVALISGFHNLRLRRELARRGILLQAHQFLGTPREKQDKPAKPAKKKA